MNRKQKLLGRFMDNEFGEHYLGLIKSHGLDYYRAYLEALIYAYWTFGLVPKEVYQARSQLSRYSHE